MRQFLDLDRYPLDRPDGIRGRQLVARCRHELCDSGMFSLAGLIRPDALERCVAEVEPLFGSAAFTHSREHNIYFDDDIEGLEAGHPALTRLRTTNHTICGDRIPTSPITRVYEWQPLIDFLAAAMDKPRLYTMADPLARLNVMAYRADDALNWHFDRAEFTTTCLLQAPLAGGEFRYRSGLRINTDPNYEGVGRLLAGEDEQVRTLPLSPGTLNVFKGRNTAHRVTPVEGARPRIIAVFSYYETPGVSFSEAERIGFYGRKGRNRMIEKRRFGRTGHMSTATIFGAAALKNVSQGEADRTLDLLLEYGVNHIDTAPRYGDAELRIGPWMRAHRGDFFLATKTGQRTYTGGAGRDPAFSGSASSGLGRSAAAPFARTPQ